MKRVVGIFKTEDQAIRAIEGLKRDGYREDEISVVTKDRGQHDRVAEVAGNVTDARDGRVDRDGDAGSKAVGGAVTGGTIGGIGGLLLGLGSFAIPGIGPIVAAGPIAAAIGGALAGGAVGGLLGALTDFGIPEEEAREYETRINAGEILVLVDADDDRRDSVYGNFYENESLNRDRYDYKRPDSDSIRGRGNMTGTGNLSDETGNMTDRDVRTSTDPRVTSAALNVDETRTTTTNEGINPFETDPNRPVDSMGRNLENETAPLDRDRDILDRDRDVIGTDRTRSGVLDRDRDVFDKDRTGDDLLDRDRLDRDRLDKDGNIYGAGADTTVVRDVDKDIRASDTFDRDKDIHTRDRDRMDDPLGRDTMDTTTHPLDRSYDDVDKESNDTLMDRDRYNTDSVNTMDPTTMDEPGRAPTDRRDTPPLDDTNRFDPESRDRRDRDLVDRGIPDTDRDVDTLENRDPLDRDIVDPDLTDPTRTRRR